MQITYPIASSQIAQPEIEPRNPPPPPQQTQESVHQATNFPNFRTKHAITGGFNLNFEKIDKSETIIAKLIT
jgi:hypothetical protein